MIVRCIYNRGKDLRTYEYEKLNKDQIGRFGACEVTEYNQITIGKEYLVMGLIVFDVYQAYLLDDNGFITVCPCQLFEVVDPKINANWCFRTIEKDEELYPEFQAIFGYPEFCFDKDSYDKLIVEMEEEAQRLYFRRKIELINNLDDI